MALTNPVKRNWISVWFLVSSLIVFWDTGYCLLRCVSGRGQRGHVINRLSPAFLLILLFPIVIQAAIDARWRLALDMEAVRALHEY